MEDDLELLRFLDPNYPRVVLGTLTELVMSMQMGFQTEHSRLWLAIARSNWRSCIRFELVVAYQDSDRGNRINRPSS